MSKLILNEIRQSEEVYDLLYSRAGKALACRNLGPRKSRIDGKFLLPTLGEFK